MILLYDARRFKLHIYVCLYQHYIVRLASFPINMLNCYGYESLNGFVLYPPFCMECNHVFCSFKLLVWCICHETNELHMYVLDDEFFFLFGRVIELPIQPVKDKFVKQLHLFSTHISSNGPISYFLF